MAVVRCTGCGWPQGGEAACPFCGTEFPDPARAEWEPSFSRSHSRAWAIAGSLVGFVALYLPAARIPGVGSVNVLELMNRTAHSPDADAENPLLQIAVLAVAISLGNLPDLLWAAAPLSLVLPGVVLVQALRADEPVQLLWAWPLLVAGPLLQLVAARKAEPPWRPLPVPAPSMSTYRVHVFSRRRSVDEHVRVSALSPEAALEKARAETAQRHHLRPAEVGTDWAD
jgi:hypothetical protein